MMKQQVMTLAVALAIAAATGLGIWSGPPFKWAGPQPTSKEMNEAANLYEGYVKELRNYANDMPALARNITRNPLAMTYALAEAEEAMAASVATGEVLKRQARAFEVLAIKFRHRAQEQAQ